MSVKKSEFIKPKNETESANGERKFIMTEEMKKSVYSVLNLIDFLETVDFLTVDFDKVNPLKQVLLASMNEEKDQPSEIAMQLKKSAYSVLNLIDFLETVDFLTVDFDKVNQLRQVLFDSMKGQAAAIKEEPDSNKKNTDKTKSSNFMNMWFDFYEKYRGKKVETNE